VQQAGLRSISNFTGEKIGAKIREAAMNKIPYMLIVGEKEADLKANKISISSPIGRGLLGKQKGEVAEVKAPTGIIRFRVEEITL